MEGGGPGGLDAGVVTRDAFKERGGEKKEGRKIETREAPAEARLKPRHLQSEGVITGPFADKEAPSFSRMQVNCALIALLGAGACERVRACVWFFVVVVVGFSLKKKKPKKTHVRSDLSCRYQCPGRPPLLKRTDNPPPLPPNPSPASVNRAIGKGPAAIKA